MRSFLPFIVLTFVLIAIPSEEIVVQFNSVNCRGITANILYKRARDAYQRNRNLGRVSQNELLLDLATKNDICSSIMARSIEFGRDTLSGIGEVAEAVNAAGQPLSTDNLSPFDKQIFLCHIAQNSFLLMQAKKSEKFIKRGIIYAPGYVNEDDELLQLMMVYDYNFKAYSENVFMCKRQIDESDTHIFFVSKEYNVNFFSDFLTNPIAARFIFSDDRCLLAIAEEPATVINSYSQEDVEKLYLDRRKGKKPASFASEDPICQLREHETFRLCGLIFNSKYIQDRFKIRFPASYSVVRDYKCQMKTISFLELRQGPKNLYQEWVALCYMSYVPFRHNPDPNLTYYVSRAYNSDTKNTISTNDIFLYKEGNYEQIYLINTFTNIRLG